jgi:ATP-dependent Clp protease adaptor protein ClpS
MTPGAHDASFRTPPISDILRGAEAVGPQLSCGRLRLRANDGYATDMRMKDELIGVRAPGEAGGVRAANDGAGNDGSGNDGAGGGSGGQRGGGRGSTGVVVKTRTKTKKPSMYKVLMLNDDYTPMEFVVHVLERFFGKNQDEATQIMLHVHRRGVGVCGVYTYEVAETKVTQVIDFARKHEHPLQCTLEKE